MARVYCRVCRRLGRLSVAYRSTGAIWTGHNPREIVVYVLDTNTLIYFFRGLGDVAKNLLSVSPNAVSIPAIVIFELQYGIARSTSPRKRAAQLEEMTSVVRVLPFSTVEAKASALLRAQLAKKGTPIGPYDVLIAGTALAHEAILVTNNAKEFKRVPKLKIENWF